MNLKNLISQSINWRKEKLSFDSKEAIRIFSGESDGVTGLFIDKYGKDFIVCSSYNHKLLSKKEQLKSILNEIYPEASLLLKLRSEDSSGNKSFFYEGNNLYSDTQEYTCLEDNKTFQIKTNPRHDFGLYLDTKSARFWVEKNSFKKKVLNLFSYTCPFGIFAAKGKAKVVVNIDPSKEYLGWGKTNADLNKLQFKLYSDTTQKYLARHLRRLESGKDTPYDLMIFDPPAFLVGRGKERMARNLWPQWLEQLKSSQCQEFLIVINDKDFAKKRDLIHFLKENFGKDSLVTSIEQSPDIQGQNPKKVDPFYFNPKVFHIQRGLS